jgi:thiol-disulfide isomerase/thioredoxin
MCLRFVCLTFILSLLIVSCKNSGNNIVIKGKLTNSKEVFIYLQELTVKNDGKTDSIKLSSGKFRFVKEVLSPSFFRIWIAGDPKQITLAVVPGERIKITGDATKLFDTYQVDGSDDSKLAQQLTQTLDKTLKQVDSLNNVYSQFKGNPNIANIRQLLTKQYNQVVDQQRDLNIKLIQNNRQSFVTILAVYQQISKNTWVFYKEEDLKYYTMVDSVMFKKYPEAPSVKVLHGNVAEIKEQHRLMQLKKLLTSVGAKAQDFGVLTPEGDSIRLSSFKGKYVLLDFWASWCKPCRDANPELMKIYKKYKSKGFEIFQVSLDKTKEAWINAIRTDGLWWKHGSDLKFWDSPVAKLYGVESIPCSFLIDKEGVLMAKGLIGDALDKKLEGIFGTAKNTESK